MRRPILAAAILCIACAAQARDGLNFLDAKSIAKSAAAAGSEAPFAAGRRDPLPAMLLREEQERRGPRGGCTESAADVCYDLAAGRIVYRPARQYMPRIDGLTPESISLRHDRIILKYSFR